MKMTGKDNRQPLHEQLRRHLEDGIASGKFQPRQLLPPEQELMAQFGVSRGTVRKAYDCLVHKGLVDRRSGQGSFVKELSTTMASARIGVVVPSQHAFDPSQDPLNWEVKLDVFNGILSEAYSHNMLPELVSYSPDILGAHRKDGYIVLDSYRELVNKMNDKVVPYSFFNLAGMLSNVRNGVSVDLQECFYQALKHLFDSGHRRVALIHKGDVLDSYWSVLREYCLPFDDELLTDSWAATSEEGFAAMERIYARTTRIDAVFCRSDIRAVGVLRFLKEKGVRVPEDISVMGFDNIKLAEENSLTTYDTRRFDAGREAVRLLASVMGMDGSPSEAGKIISLSGHIVERGTVMPKRPPESAAVKPAKTATARLRMPKSEVHHSGS